MATFDRFSIKVVAGVGLFGAAIALSPDVAATPLKTGGYACMQGAAGEVGAPAVAGGAAAVAGASTLTLACGSTGVSFAEFGATSTVGATRSASNDPGCLVTTLPAARQLSGRAPRIRKLAGIKNSP